MPLLRLTTDTSVCIVNASGKYICSVDPPPDLHSFPPSSNTTTHFRFYTSITFARSKSSKMFSKIAVLGFAALAAAAPSPNPQSIDFVGVAAAGSGSVSVSASTSSMTQPLAIVGYFPEPLTLSGTAAINALVDCQGTYTYMGYRYFNDGAPFDPTRCAQACTDLSNYNVAHPPASGSPQTCQFFNAYILNKNGQPQGQYCALYSEQWGNQYATNTGQYRGTDSMLYHCNRNEDGNTNGTSQSTPSPTPRLTSTPPTTVFPASVPARPTPPALTSSRFATEIRSNPGKVNYYPRKVRRDLKTFLGMTGLWKW